jgi:non-canonical purine NTP pyrophosphatase (RdgB/HAM1 family)
MKIKKLTFVTSNKSKAEQLGRHLEFPVVHKKIDVKEIQSSNLREIVEEKVKEAYKIVKGPVLVEDTSLTFTALNGLPGPFIKWFLTSLRNDGLCKLLDSYKNRSAFAEVCFGLYDGKQLLFFEGKMEGKISTEVKGEEGFGWDPIFIPKGYKKTWGQMTAEEQSKTSMRRIGLKKLEEYLKNSSFL